MKLEPGLIVSCQSEPGSPFDMPSMIAGFALSAERGGAVAVRICGLANIRFVNGLVSIPIIGLTKREYPGGEVLITGSIEDVKAIKVAGPVALDATHRKRPDGLTGVEMVHLAKKEHATVVADVSMLAEGIDAIAAGADYLTTALSGYTKETVEKLIHGPDFDLIAALSKLYPGKVIAEGRIGTPEEARKALDLGAHAVCVGSAITKPIEITKRFARTLK